MPWTELETSTHQDHVIKHVIGATVLGWFIAGDAAHFLLDIGFLWTVYLDGEMNLLPQGVAISELEGDELMGLERTELAFDAQLLLAGGRSASDLKRFTAAPLDCLIVAVEFFGSDSHRRILVTGDDGKIEIETSLETSQVFVRANQ